MDPVTKNLRALQGALEHSLTIQRTRLQEIVDDLVSRGHAELGPTRTGCSISC